ncbi:acyltransferase [Polaribacter marinaquae]|uniref:Acyltransferase n=1 Tax=Polaribacter marinaquae TaxID=1642819 RepID=A0ABZ2TUP4_9FLAO
MIKSVILFFRFILSGLNYLFNLLMFKVNGVEVNSFLINGRILVRNKGSIKLGAGFTANSGKMINPIGGDTCLRLICSIDGMLHIHENVGISNSTIVCWDKIIIHKNVLIGGGCKIWDTNFHSINSIDRLNGDMSIKTSPIEIMESVFIGANCTILKGVSIGENSVIAAGSVVTKDIPSNQIWGGNPAVFIKKI